MLQPNFTAVLAGDKTLAELLFTTWWWQNGVVMGLAGCSLMHFANKCLALTEITNVLVDTMSKSEDLLIFQGSPV